MGIRSVTHRRKWRDDVIRRLDELAKVQAETTYLQSESAKLQIKMTERYVEKETEKFGRRPSKLGWVLIIIYVIVSAAAVAISAYYSAQNSMLDGQAAALNQQSQFLSLQSNQDLMESDEDLMIAIQTHDPAAVKAGLKEMRLAGEANSEANRLLPINGGKLQNVNQIALALSSAFFGAVLGWIITKGFDVIRSTSRRRDLKSSQLADDDPRHAEARRTPSA